MTAVDHIRARTALIPRVGIVLGALGAMRERVHAASHQIDKTFRWPAEGRTQLNPVLHRDPPRCAGPRIAQASPAL